MKKVTFQSTGTIDGFSTPEHDLGLLAEQLDAIAGAQKGGTLTVTVTVRGALLSDAPGAIVAAHSEIDDILRATKTDLLVNTVREPKSDASETRKPAKVTP